MSALTDRELIEMAMTLAHMGHDGIPAAPEGIKCPRCIAESALDRLERLANLAILSALSESFRMDCGCIPHAGHKDDCPRHPAYSDPRPDPSAHPEYWTE